MAVVDEGLYRQELHRRHTQALEVVDDRPGTQSGIGPAQFGWNVRMQSGETFDMQFIDHGLMPGDVGALVTFPVEIRIDDLTPGHPGRTVAAAEAQILLWTADAVSELSVAPLDPTDDGFGVRVEQQLVRVETVPLVGPVRPMHPVAIQLAGTDFGQIGMPDLIGLLGNPDSLLFQPPAGVEQA
jgi:hypothetical protein